ncbi:MAG: hypothetical protein ACF8MF_11645 [Phycisphaerales bacterium JB052]
MARRSVRISLVVVLFLVLGFIGTLLQTWFAVNFFENRYARGWAHVLRFASFRVADPSSTGWMLGEPTPNWKCWRVLVTRDHAGRFYQIRYRLWDAGVDNGERDLRPGMIPDWTRIKPVPSPAEVRGLTQILEQRNGWPFPAWRGEVRQNRRGGVAEYSYCLPISPTGFLGDWEQLIVIPYEPIFPGVLYNAAIFGSGFFLIVFVFKHYRRRFVRWSRLSQLECPSCKYSIRGLSTCPECGEEIDPEMLPTHLGRAKAGGAAETNADP